jgi:hypothetical protein
MVDDVFTGNNVYERDSFDRLLVGVKDEWLGQACVSRAQPSKSNEPQKDFFYHHQQQNNHNEVLGVCGGRDCTVVWLSCSDNGISICFRCVL